METAPKPSEQSYSEQRQDVEKLEKAKSEYSVYKVGDTVEFDLSNPKAAEFARLGPSSQLKPRKVVSVENLSDEESSAKGFSQRILCENTSYYVSSNYFKRV